MSIRTAETIWTGTLKDGSGNMKVESGAFDVPFSWATRFSDTPGTNPEELIAAALGGCFTMSLSAKLTAAGYAPDELRTSTRVHSGRDDIGAHIVKIEMETTAHVPGVSEEVFNEAVRSAKSTCPISRSLGAVPEITVQTTLNP